MRNLFLALFVAGCAQGVDIDPEVIVPALATDLAVETIKPCGMAFDPDPKLLGATVSAVERWSSATGCDVRVEEGGVPVYGHEHLYSTSELDREICGRATWSEDGSEVIRIDISLACSDLEDTVTHEIGHALAGLKRHSFTGVMASGMNEDRTHAIDAASLELVCYLFPCLLLKPEI